MLDKNIQNNQKRIWFDLIARNVNTNGDNGDMNLGAFCILESDVETISVNNILSYVYEHKSEFISERQTAFRYDSELYIGGAALRFNRPHIYAVTYDGTAYTIRVSNIHVI